MTAEASELIAALGLIPHPEGGWYRETFRAPAPDGSRSIVTAIYFLLESGQASHWHRVDAVEIWCWHAGSALELGVAADDASAAVWTKLGPEIAAGEAPQAVIPTGHWQAARAENGWALVSCIVAPGFDFGGFELAAHEWSPG